MTPILIRDLFPNGSLVQNSMKRRIIQFESHPTVSDGRSGFVLMWIIIAIPAILFLLGAVVDISRVWIARMELTNALEAAALSGVKTWGEATPNNSTARSSARQDAVIAAAANTVTGLNPLSPSDAVALVLDANDNSGNPNSNASTTGDIVLGQLTSSGSGFAFDADATPATGEFAVRTQKSVQIHSIWTSLLGIPLGPYDIQSGAVAIYDGQPRIAHVLTYSP